MNCRETVEYLKSHDKYLLLTHKRPDGDTIGSAAALRELLQRLGKTAWLLESRDATKLLAGYLEGRIAPADFVPETVVSVDVASLELLPPNAREYRDRIDLAIDHHPSNAGFAGKTWLEADRAACGELIWELCEECGVMDSTIAALLYVAVSTDTGCFLYSNTTAHTHRVAAMLLEQGIDMAKLNKRHFRTKSMGRLRLESLLIQNTRLYHGGSVAIAPISLALMKEAGAGDDDAEDIAAFAGQIEGVVHCATIRENQNGECRISLRTDPRLLNATAVCARLGGGGHAAASGCTVKGTMEEAEKAILNAIEAELSEEDHG